MWEKRHAELIQGGEDAVKGSTFMQMQVYKPRREIVAVCRNAKDVIAQRLRTHKRGVRKHP